MTFYDNCLGCGFTYNDPNLEVTTNSSQINCGPNGILELTQPESNMQPVANLVTEWPYGPNCENPIKFDCEFGEAYMEPEPCTQAAAGQIVPIINVNNPVGYIRDEVSIDYNIVCPNCISNANKQVAFRGNIDIATRINVNDAVSFNGLQIFHQITVFTTDNTDINSIIGIDHFVGGQDQRDVITDTQRIPIDFMFNCSNLTINISTDITPGAGTTHTPEVTATLQNKLFFLDRC